MNTRRAITAFALAVVAAACSSSTVPSASGGSATTRTEPATTTTVAADVAVDHLTFVDASRPTGQPSDAFHKSSRTLPTDLYLPRQNAPAPLVVLAHGASGDPAKFSNLLHAWADAGFVAAAPRFPASSSERSGGAGNAGVADYQQQPADVSFVITQLLASKWSPRIDPTRIGVAGLSLGGGTVYGLQYRDCCRDTRVKAVAIFDSLRFPFPQPFTKNVVPVLIMHIDTDYVLPYAKARESFASSASPKWLVTLFGGIHPEPYEDTPSPHDGVVIATTIDYWKLTLLGDTAAGGRMMTDANVPGNAKIERG